ncbi:MAG: ParB/RepB/Spo0J family partition protein [Candidatus Aminicenantes bacterium]|jgi:ParB family chromosome partitioning protein|nr:ParB/RepB/Spo0J family partition protein [Candidatus Aminicenantes bacterium]MDH5383244.1 ParB/RepB/Spo0J family partition protein [Candidatus Aminicenantes bacterium]MDH5742756.1 ParB/RepB/Spo0J family partition protein [Candidatus Aminicenantes bacterium]
MKKRALGKGLKAFLPEDYGILKDEKYVDVDVEDLKPNPLQPRQDFDKDSIDELAHSMKETGVLQPIVVVPEENHYKIVVGERRWRAARKIGLQKIPAVVRHLSEKQQIEASLVENLQRKDLNPIEIAFAYQKLIHELKYSQEDVAEKVGKDRASVANYIRLLKLPQEIQRMVAEGKLSMGHARALITLENPDQQVFISRLIVEKNLSVRDVEKMMTEKRRAPAHRKPQELDPDLQVLQEEFIKILGTKVSISGNSEKGIIRLYYFSLEDLNRIFEKIKGV